MIANFNVKLLVLLILFNQTMSSQDFPNNFYPNKITGEELDTFSHHKKTEIKTVMLDKYGKPLDKNVTFFKLDEFNVYDDAVCLVSSNIVAEGYLCPFILLDHMSGSNVTNETDYQTILDNLEIFSLHNTKQIDSCLQKLGAIVDYNVELENDASEYLDTLSQKLNQTYKKIKTKEAKQEIYLYSFVLIGEKIKRKTGAEWVISLQADFKHDVQLRNKGKNYNVYTFMKNFGSGINIGATVKAIIGK